MSKRKLNGESGGRFCRYSVRFSLAAELNLPISLKDIAAKEVI